MIYRNEGVANSAKSQRCSECPHRLADFWQHVPEEAEETQSLKHQRDDESVTNREEASEIRRPRRDVIFGQADGNATGTFEEEDTHSTTGSEITKTAVASNQGIISGVSGITCLTSAEEITYRILCGRCSTPSTSLRCGLMVPKERRLWGNVGCALPRAQRTSHHRRMTT